MLSETRGRACDAPEGRVLRQAFVKNVDTGHENPTETPKNTHIIRSHFPPTVEP